MVDKGGALCYPALELSHGSTEDNVVSEQPVIGIGGGLILDDRLYHDATGMAGEIGHTTVLPYGPLCGCGNRGCLEALASGSAIARRARERVAHGVPTRIADLAGNDPELITAKLVAEAASEGDAEAQGDPGRGDELPGDRDGQPAQPGTHRHRWRADAHRGTALRTGAARH